jgi:hypothetical protein
MSAEQIKNIYNRISNIDKEIHKLKSPHAPGKQHPAEVSPEQASTNQGEPTPRSSLAIPPSPASPNQPKQSAQTRTPRRNFGRRVWRWIKRIFLKRDRLERIGILFGVAYAITTILQWRDLRRNFVTDERAWVNIAPLEQLTTMPVDSVQALIINARMVNSGKTPATKGIHIECVVEIVKATTPPSFDYNGFRAITDIPLIFPTHVSDVPCMKSTGNILNPVPVTPDQRRDLKSGALYLAIFGKIDYRDQFGPHWTHFCWWQGFAEGAMVASRPCVDYNDVDGN